MLSACCFVKPHTSWFTLDNSSPFMPAGALKSLTTLAAKAFNCWVISYLSESLYNCCVSIFSHILSRFYPNHLSTYRACFHIPILSEIGDHNGVGKGRQHIGFARHQTLVGPVQLQQVLLLQGRQVPSQLLHFRDDCLSEEEN